MSDVRCDNLESNQYPEMLRLKAEGVCYLLNLSIERSTILN